MTDVPSILRDDDRSPDTQTSPLCPLCNRELTQSFSAQLYDEQVCLACSEEFSRLRASAYMVDAAVWSWAIFLTAATLSWFLGPSNRMEWLLYLPVFIGAPMFLGTAVLPVFLLNDLVMFAFSFAVNLLFLVKDGFSGYTVGRSLFGLRVVDRDTLEPVGFVQSFKRNLPLMLPFLIGHILVGANQRGFRPGDGWANTKVIWTRYTGNRVFGGLGRYCRACRYDLTGNVSGVCPECGTLITHPKCGSAQALLDDRPRGC